MNQTNLVLQAPDGGHRLLFVHVWHYALSFTSKCFVWAINEWPSRHAVSEPSDTEDFSIPIGPLFTRGATEGQAIKLNNDRPTLLIVGRWMNVTMNQGTYLLYYQRGSEITVGIASFGMPRRHGRRVDKPLV